MKVKTISRPADYARECKGDIFKVSRNLDENLHPFARQREYSRALNHTKLSRMFAKPFLFQMEGHRDSIYSLAKNYENLNQMASGSFDGEIRIWNINSKSSIVMNQKSNVKGLCFYKDELYSIGDKEIHIFKQEKQQSFVTSNVLNSITHHFDRDIFCTSSTVLELWDTTRQESYQTMQWGCETIQKVVFNNSETNVLLSCGSDRSIILYDIRTSVPITKTIMNLKTNSMCWNPMEPFNFTTASEDHNCYTFDMRHMGNTLCVHKGHVSAVMDIDYSPTGEEFVTGSFDKTIRIFGSRDGKSRDIYHTKRMQRAFQVLFSMDSKYIFSGSDDGSIRAWKANASEQLGVLTEREKSKQAYGEALKNRYKNIEELNKIDRHRRVPKAISKATSKKQVMLNSIKQKESNRRAHSKPGTVPFKAERKKHILTTEE